MQEPTYVHENFQTVSSPKTIIPKPLSPKTITNRMIMLNSSTMDNSKRPKTSCNSNNFFPTPWTRTRIKRRNLSSHYNTVQRGQKEFDKIVLTRKENIVDGSSAIP